jgi:hypothetical protein
MTRHVRPETLAGLSRHRTCPAGNQTWRVWRVCHGKVIRRLFLRVTHGFTLPDSVPRERKAAVVKAPTVGVMFPLKELPACLFETLRGLLQ